MRGLLIFSAVLATGLAAAPGGAAQRAPATFIPPSAGNELFLESWLGAELRTAGLKPLWTPAGLEGYRERYRLTVAGASAGVMIVTIDVDYDGTGVVLMTRKRPGGIIERDQRALYVPGKIAWKDRREVDPGPIRRLQRMFDAQGFFRQSFRAGAEVPDELAAQCTDGVSYLIEVRDGSGYHAITRNNCDVADASTLIEGVMKLSGGWPRR